MWQQNIWQPYIMTTQYWYYLIAIWTLLDMDGLLVVLGKNIFAEAVNAFHITASVIFVDFLSVMVTCKLFLVQSVQEQMFDNCIQ